MKKIIGIIAILVLGFMFQSCSNGMSDPEYAGDPYTCEHYCYDDEVIAHNEVIAGSTKIVYETQKKTCTDCGAWCEYKLTFYYKLDSEGRWHYTGNYSTSDYQTWEGQTYYEYKRGNYWFLP